MSEADTVEIVVPDDASTLTNTCDGLLNVNGDACPDPAHWWVLTSCSACHYATLWAYCDTHTRIALKREKRGDITKCCHAPFRVTVEAK